ncbi:HigA family addiction module antitoxin [Desulfobaculum bizertense]|uniref:Plasmid maintenance system antidote protein, XRE family n=1 Tax=Desulfobaculum bizertense DSM 18034 TaxID=1121442 RepID=A0A1T4WYZ4_9BACT|nr:HigA family addiction module antitoxin [Desulfobaculum bizertense]UIJ38535.1 HigA family addiction module antitoxin [Desulfobaculum bizertense]UIJ38691.1 HigA family addiction module antitoxin [Desulfobaculum bizertense]SKA81801.1 plasmid maintenance system antidote protein, XRE family [Desulfobaculum bizertense DSM 18034]
MTRITTHPGEILKEEFMVPYELSASKLSGYLGVPLSRITEIVREKRGVSADTAIRLAKFFGTTPEFWTNLQARHDFSKIQAEKKTELQRIPTCQEVGACMVS